MHTSLVDESSLLNSAHDDPNYEVGFDRWSLRTPPSPQSIRGADRSVDIERPQDDEFLHVQRLSPLPGPQSIGSNLDDRAVTPFDAVGLPEDLEHHHRFWFKSGDVLFNIESTQFNVHSDVLNMHSSEFGRLFPPSGTAHVPKGVLGSDFERFLAVFYPAALTDVLNRTVDEWSSVIELATRWSFSSVRALAVHSLSTLASPAERIALARKYSIGDTGTGESDWLVPAHIVLCQRKEGLTDSEVNVLPKEDIATAFRARERGRRDPRRCDDCQKWGSMTCQHATAIDEHMARAAVEAEVKLMWERQVAAAALNDGGARVEDATEHDEVAQAVETVPEAETAPGKRCARCGHKSKKK